MCCFVGDPTLCFVEYNFIMNTIQLTFILKSYTFVKTQEQYKYLITQY